jgi:hypothetical protein
MSRRIFLEEPRIVFPQPTDPPAAPQGFTIMPASSLPCQTPDQWAFMQWVYEQAMEKAKATVRPSIVERDLLGYWN